MTQASTSCSLVFALIPQVQTYEWGIKGRPCLVAQFAEATSQLEFKADDDTPYAELWMGTHASLPSKVVSCASSSYDTLSCHLKQHRHLIGESVLSKFDDQQDGCLPFLFKVLSVGKALSIQAHPDKQLAKQLHTQRSHIYKDPNHKPEMAIALTRFSGFCGFRPLCEIVDFINNVAELADLVKLSSQQLESAIALASQNVDPNSDSVKQMLKLIFGNLMRSSSETYQAKADQITRRFACLSVDQLGVPLRERNLLLQLSEQFPRDVGIFCTFLLNITTLEPGEALFLQANEPHAYLEGEILECMASSDNVVRAGLTPKLRDVETLISMCTYQSGKDRGRLEPQPWNHKQAQGEALLYDPPIQEFSVVVSCLQQPQSIQKHDRVQGPSILITLQGSGQIRFQKHNSTTTTTIESIQLEKAGQVVFIAADTEIQLVRSNHADCFKVARAFVEA